MAKKDLYVCDFCPATKAMDVDRCGTFGLLCDVDVPPGWGRLSLEMREAEPTFEKASHAFDMGCVGEGTFERRIDIGSPFRMEGVVVTEGPTDGWSLVGLFVGDRPVLETPTPLAHFKEDFKGVQDAFFITSVPPGLLIRGYFSFDGRRRDMLRGGVAVPQVSVVGKDLLSVGYGQEQRATGESVLCGSCCEKLQLIIGEREVPLKPSAMTMSPMDPYLGDVGEDRGFIAAQPVMRHRPMIRPMVRRSWR